MRFHPLPVLTAVFLPALALLLALGTWQVQRAGWKADLVAEWAARESGPARPLADALCAARADGPVEVTVPPEGPEIRMYAPGPAGEPGWAMLRAGRGEGCWAPVQTGFEILNGPRRPAPARLILEPWPEIGPFTPENAPEREEYYRFTPDGLAAAFGLPEAELAPLWARWETRSPEERVAIAPADHVGYAVTWFGLAAALVGVYLALHLRAGRLSFGRRR